MSYRRAWLLVDSLNTSFPRAGGRHRSGGRHGGGAHLTPFGRELIESCRTMERYALRATQTQVDAIEHALAPDRLLS